MSSRVVQQAYSSIAPVYIDRFGSVESVHADDLAIIERHLTHLERLRRGQDGDRRPHAVIAARAV